MYIIIYLFILLLYTHIYMYAYFLDYIDIWYRLQQCHLCLILVSLVVLYNTDLDKRSYMFYLYFYFIYFLGCFNVVNTTEQSLYFGF